MTITNIILCLIAGISLAYARSIKRESKWLIERRNEYINQLEDENERLEKEINLFEVSISEAIQEADENERWG